jgi:hypothetical protein
MAEGIDYRPDGTIHINAGDRQVVLRRPTIRDYRELRNAQAELAARLTTLRGDPDQVDEFTELAQEWALDWVTQVIARLGDGGFPDDPDEWPVWLTSFTLPGRIVDHWQTVPLASGTPSATT